MTDADAPINVDHVRDRRPAPRTQIVRREIDVPGVEAATRALLEALGQAPDAPGTADTPGRVAKAWAEMLSPEPFTATTFENDGGYDELVVVKDIPFWSLCEHHLLPFHGVAHVAYLPGERIVGLSKLARVVDTFARDLQVQERLTAQVADWLTETLQPQGVGVVLEAEHLCMVVRGVKKSGSRTVTSALRGILRDDARTRAEFLGLVR
jgi:GTP cyclohydrolase I